MYIAPEHFHSNITPDEAQKVFSLSIRYMDLGIASYCNRVCDYCPNSFVDRRSQKNYMSDDVYFNIMRHLAKIDYHNYVTINRYCEPLANFDYALSRIRDMSKFIPKAHLWIHTNGDYLTKEKALALGKIGMPIILNAKCHPQPGERNAAKQRAQLKSRLDALDLPYKITVDEPNEMMAMVEAEGIREFFYAATDYYFTDENGLQPQTYDRAQSLKVNNAYQRTLPCLAQFNEMQIEWDGTLWPCCNIHNDVPEHKQFKIGAITGDSNIFVDFFSPAYIAWRRQMLNFDLKSPPCANCNYFNVKLEDTPELRNAVAIIRAQLMG